ncbi:MAG: hypothetical protein QMC14_07500, partial [Paracoccaceae bacterium]
MTADRVPLGRCLPRRDIAGANRPQTARATALKRAAGFGWGQFHHIIGSQRRGCVGVRLLHSAKQ